MDVGFQIKSTIMVERVETCAPSSMANQDFRSQNSQWPKLTTKTRTPIRKSTNITGPKESVDTLHERFPGKTVVVLTPVKHDDVNTNHDVTNVTVADAPLKVVWICYLLVSLDYKRTYVGSTVNLKRRIRQHNGEIKGGAKYTLAYSHIGWKIIGTVNGFNSKNECLSFEWHWKNKSRKLLKAKSPLEKRLIAKDILLSSSTQNLVFSNFKGNEYNQTKQNSRRYNSH